MSLLKGLAPSAVLLERQQAGQAFFILLPAGARPFRARVNGEVEPSGKGAAAAAVGGVASPVACAQSHLFSNQVLLDRGNAEWLSNLGVAAWVYTCERRPNYGRATRSRAMH